MDSYIYIKIFINISEGLNPVTLLISGAFAKGMHGPIAHAQNFLYRLSNFVCVSFIKIVIWLVWKLFRMYLGYGTFNIVKRKYGGGRLTACASYLHDLWCQKIYTWLLLLIVYAVTCSNVTCVYGILSLQLLLCQSFFVIFKKQLFQFLFLFLKGVRGMGWCEIYGWKVGVGKWHGCNRTAIFPWPTI